ncbi:STAS domain-containing protein [Bacterioplanoides sp. SCSIO 12839]|uniref:STAS domain-containing protein n=1 Tax=Bacterioplanoides sp. SCSIO 12839 TaxID=2829569 RepID=UPI002107DA33|nr:STAS domain-containing protein [Bacterioplanoides sp. SCSIO 12839]UTW48939.1 STAS domain-containing protein [Bacterioplanoides sp. SCSIO 12839]
MTVQASLAGNGQELMIKIDGRFDFSAHQEFRDAYEGASGQITSYTVDMASTSYLDSSALGMLLLLRDHAGGDNANVKIVNCNQDVRKILTISNFEQLFTIQ